METREGITKYKIDVLKKWFYWIRYFEQIKRQNLTISGYNIEEYWEQIKVFIIGKCLDKIPNVLNKQKALICSFIIFKQAGYARAQNLRFDGIKQKSPRRILLKIGKPKERDQLLKIINWDVSKGK